MRLVVLLLLGLSACAPPPRPAPAATCILLMIRGDSVSVFLPPCNERQPLVTSQPKAVA